MLSNRSLSIVVAAALGLALPAHARQGEPPANAPPESYELLQGDADRDARMTIPVLVEGSGPYHFLLDTGSQATVLSQRLAGELGLPAGPSITITGMAGTQLAATAEVDNLAIGSLLLGGLTTPLLDYAHIGADGIIGTDSLQDRRVLFDFTTNRITVSESIAPRADKDYEIVVRARSRSGRLVMTHARIGRVTVRVVIDTGSSTSVGNLALRRALKEKVLGQLQLESVTGHQLQAEYSLGQKLTIGAIQVDNLFLAFADGPAFRELGLDKRPAMFLGMRELRVFQRIAIDFHRNTILFDLPG